MVSEKKNPLHVFVRWLNRKKLSLRITVCIHLASSGSYNAMGSESDPGVVSLIPARSHTFVEIDCEIYSVVILSFRWIKIGWCKLKAKVCA